MNFIKLFLNDYFVINRLVNHISLCLLFYILLIIYYTTPTPKLNYEYLYLLTKLSLYKYIFSICWF